MRHIQNIKKTIMKMTAVFIIAVISAVSGVYAAAADTSAKLSIPQNIAPGEDFKITVTFSSNVNIGSVKARLDYDSSVIEFESGEFASGGGGLCLINGWSESAGKTSTFELTFKSVGEGSSQIKLERVTVYSDSGDLIGSPEATAAVTVKSKSSAQTTSITTAAPEQTSETTTSVSQTVTESVSVTTAPADYPADPGNVITDPEQTSDQATDPDESADDEDSAIDDDSSDSSSDSDSSKSGSDAKGSITAILLIVGCIAIACILMMNDNGGKNKRSSRSRKR